MKLTGCPAGLLINFNVPRLIDGVKRLINDAGGAGPAADTWTEARSPAWSSVPPRLL
jgi:hypothetical protein